MGNLEVHWDWITGFCVGFDIIWDLGIQFNLGVITIFVFWGFKSE